eukprot:TRINITY_DN5283_c0_g1_i1.p2 TRINITY_DN5283_c0_g1~~TRINITY_DN5283_c0_g1_i1.p2  ORF type:complete len:228 (-),score=49.61 TRINITY_DN5283_c0_g1_i1:142-825(-)
MCIRDRVSTQSTWVTHLEGRIIDIYTRVTGELSKFFLPFDNEVSKRYFRWVIDRMKKQNRYLKGVGEGSKHTAITYHTVKDPEGDFKKDINHITIYRRQKDMKLVLFRHFIKSGDGSICEMEESVPFDIDNYPLLETWPKLLRKHLASTHNSRMDDKEEFQFTLKDNTPIKRAIEEEEEEIKCIPHDEDELEEPEVKIIKNDQYTDCLLYTSPSPRDLSTSRMPSSA